MRLFFIQPAQDVSNWGWFVLALSEKAMLADVIILGLKAR
jgi:hypothetical protein